MFRNFTLLVCLLFVVAGCDLLQVPPPPVPLSAVNQIEASAAPTSTGGSRTNTRLVRALPPRALASLHLPNIGAAIRRFKKTGLYKLFTSPELKRLLGPNAIKFEASLLKIDGAPPQAQKLLKALQGEFAIALEDVRTDGDALEVRVVAAISVTGAEAEAEQLIEMLGMFAANANGTRVEKGTVERTSFSRIVTTKPPLVVEVALYRDAVLFGVGRDTVTAAIRRLATPGSSSLVNDKSYAACMKRCATANDAMRVHVDMGSAYARYKSHLPEEARELIAKLKLDSIRGLAASIGLDGEDIVIRTLVESPGGKDAFTRFVGSQAVDRQFLGRIPGEATAFSLFSLDGEFVLATLRDVLPTTERRQLEDGLAHIRQQGFDVERDILEVFGPRAALINLPYEGAANNPIEAIWNHLLGAALVFEIQDPKRAAALLARLPERGAGMRRREYVAEGTPAIAYRLEGGQVPMNFALALAIQNGYLVVAPSEETLRRMLKHRAPTTVERYKELVRDAPRNATILSYEDMRGGPGFLLQGFLASLITGVNTNVKAGFDWNALSTALGGLGHSVSYTVADKDGVFSETRSPTGGIGSAGGVAGLAVVAAVAIPNLQHARVRANETAALAALRAIHTAQTSFRGSASRDSDNDSVGEYGFLQELLGQNRPGETNRHRRRLSFEFEKAKRAHRRHGYHFRIYLPAEDGTPIGGHFKLKSINRVDGDLAESIFYAVAWPAERGTTGNRAFLLDYRGQIYETKVHPYTGTKGPRADLLCEQKRNLASRPLKRGEPTRDGCDWTRAR